METENKYICASCQEFVNKVTYDESKDNDFCDDCKTIDLFSTPELLPEQIKAILDSFDCETLSYQDCQSMLAQMEKLGYTFEFGLDAVPFNLRISENQSIESMQSENDKVLNFIKEFQSKNDYNPKFLDQYNAKFNAEFNDFLNSGNFSQKTIDLFTS
jgi:hypothetical protein